MSHPLTGPQAASYIAYPPAATMAGARLYHGAVIYVLAFADMHGRAEMSVSLTAAEFERLRAAFPEIPCEFASGGSHG